MEGTRTSARYVVDIFIDYQIDEMSVMGPVKEVHELFGCKVYVLENLPSNQLLVIDDRGKGIVLTLSEEERVR